MATPFRQHITGRFRPAEQLFSGKSTAQLVPDVFPVAINGRAYQIDRASNQYVRGFDPRVRDSQDTSTAPGEAAINPQGLWRRGEVSWHYGAGQKYGDTAESQDFRFHTSKGVNPWTKGQLTLLNATKLSLSSAATTQRMVIQDGRVYVSLDEEVKFSTDPFASSPTWTDCTGEPGGGKKCVAMTTDGDRIYFGFESDGVRVLDPGTSTTVISGTKLINTTDNYYMLGFGKGFLFGSHDHKLRNISATGGTADIIEPVDTAWRWVGVATGQNAIYAAGYASKKSLVYKITIKSDGTLDKGIAALELPTGEVATSIAGYLGFIILGTNKGVRFCSTDSNSNLVAGSLIPTSGSVLKSASNDRFSYFTWSNYDGVSTGLGRLDLSTFTSPNTPAYATDLMYTSTADVTNVVIFNDKAVFTVSGVGVVVEDTANLVASGEIVTSTYRWGIPDRKFIARVDVRTTPLVGSITPYVSLDSAAYAELLAQETQGTVESVRSAPQDKFIEAKLKFELARRDTTNGPTLTRWMARAYATPARSQLFTVPLLMHSVLRLKGGEYFFNVQEELATLRNLVTNPRIVNYQENDDVYSVIVEDVQFQAMDTVGSGNEFEGTAIVSMRSVQD